MTVGSRRPVSANGAWIISRFIGSLGKDESDV